MKKEIFFNFDGHCDGEGSRNTNLQKNFMSGPVTLSSARYQIEFLFFYIAYNSFLRNLDAIIEDCQIR